MKEQRIEVKIRPSDFYWGIATILAAIFIIKIVTNETLVFIIALSFFLSSLLSQNKKIEEYLNYKKMKGGKNKNE